MIKKCHYDVILWGGFGSTKCDPNLTSHLRRFFAGRVILYDWGFGGTTSGKFSEINPYFLQSEAFCDLFQDIIKTYFPNKIL